MLHVVRLLYIGQNEELLSALIQRHVAENRTRVRGVAEAVDEDDEGVVAEPTA